MSEQETTGAARSLDVIDSTGTSVAKLVELARQAYEQKRTKDCLDFTRAILLMDPENAEALLMRSSIRAEMYQDLETARAVLQQARDRKAGLETSPQQSHLPAKEDEEAEVLVSETSLVALPKTIPGQFLVVTGRSGRALDAIRTPKRRWLKRASVIVFFGLVAAGLPRFRSKANLVEVPASLGASAVSIQAPVGNASNAARVAADIPHLDMTPRDWWLPDTDPASTVVAPGASSFAVPRPLPQKDIAVQSQPEQSLAANRDKPVVAVAAPGTLAISSTTPVDIYMADRLVGSAPVSLEMPAGTHTIEYRHGSLRKSVTHSVTSGEITKATISFDVVVQVNSKPWADVFLDGSEKKPLGQTPLSGVRVPIGSVLVFENPDFRAKRYRVTGNETGIQVVFP